MGYITRQLMSANLEHHCTQHVLLSRDIIRTEHAYWIVSRLINRYE